MAGSLSIIKNLNPISGERLDKDTIKIIMYGTTVIGSLFVRNYPDKPKFLMKIEKDKYDNEVMN